MRWPENGGRNTISREGLKVDNPLGNPRLEGRLQTEKSS
jgi:hypothetical protein